MLKSDEAGEVRTKLAESRVGTASLAWVELLENLVQLHPRIMEVNFYPARTSGYSLTSVALAPSLDE